MRKKLRAGRNHSIKKINTPLSGKDIKSLAAGSAVLLSGTIYTARDQAHLRFMKNIEKSHRLPVDLKGQIIYYSGPTPRGKRIIGSCGPTTSGRMDNFTPAVLDAGVKGIIGKGRRSTKVREAVKKAKAVYFLAPSGAGAYLSEKVKSSRVVAFKDLGPEAVYRLEVIDFPLIVGIDAKGNDIYERLNN
jgi:fumarate hydratase subunit beta